MQFSENVIGMDWKWTNILFKILRIVKIFHFFHVCVCLPFFHENLSKVPYYKAIGVQKKVATADVKIFLDQIGDIC